MADVLTREQRSYNMSQIRGKDTGPEMLLRKGLWKMGFRYRIHYKLPGRPDIVFAGRRIAIFVDGCFWHGCPDHGVRPKTNSTFWNKKIQGTMDRDKRNQQQLEKEGWTVLRFWEHDIDKNLSALLKKLQHLIEQK
ncbi:MAG TPA: very short patch repair endonuclease [Puia sp.]|nr:very short patch repair endonuclease [Puia sp.]